MFPTTAMPSAYSPSLLDRLRYLLPNVALSILVSIAASIALTGISAALSATFGLPLFPFLFIMI